MTIREGIRSFFDKQLAMGIVVNEIVVDELSSEKIVEFVEKAVSNGQTIRSKMDKLASRDECDVSDATFFADQIRVLSKNIEILQTDFSRADPFCIAALTSIITTSEAFKVFEGLIEETDNHN